MKKKEVVIPQKVLNRIARTLAKEIDKDISQWIIDQYAKAVSKEIDEELLEWERKVLHGTGGKPPKGIIHATTKLRRAKQSPTKAKRHDR